MRLNSVVGTQGQTAGSMFLKVCIYPQTNDLRDEELRESVSKEFAINRTC